MGLGLSSEQQWIGKASDSVGESNRPHLKLQYIICLSIYLSILFFPFLPALWFDFFPHLNNHSPGFTILESHLTQGLAGSLWVPVQGKHCSWPCPLKEDQKDAWVTQASLINLSEAQPVLWRAGHCGSWVTLPATSVLRWEGAMKREFQCSQPALVESLYQKGPAHEAVGEDVML